MRCTAPTSSRIDRFRYAELCGSDRRRSSSSGIVNGCVASCKLAALAIGFDARIGLYGGTVVVALLLGVLGSRRAGVDDVLIGGVFTWVLGLGVLFLSMYASSSRSSGESVGVTVLFGSVFSLDAECTRLIVLVAAAVCVVLAVVARPLLFATVDGAVASSRGVAVGILGYVFLVLVGLTAAEATQAVGALLFLGLLAAPAGTAMRLTANPLAAFGLSGVVAVGVMWAGLWLSRAVPSVPPSVAVVGVAGVVYLSVLLITTGRRARIA